MRGFIVLLMTLVLLTGCQPEMRRKPEPAPEKQNSLKVLAQQDTPEVPSLSLLDQHLRITLDFDPDRSPQELKREALTDVRDRITLVRGALDAAPDTLWLKTTFQLSAFPPEFPLLLECRLLRGKADIERFRTVLLAPKSKRLAELSLPREFSTDLLKAGAPPEEELLAHVEAIVTILPPDADFEALKRGEKPQKDHGSIVVLSNPVRLLLNQKGSGE